MRRVVVTGMGMVTPVGPRPGFHLVGAAGRPERRRADRAVRRPDLPDADRRGGPRLPPGRLPAGRLAVGGALAQHQVRPGRRHDGDEGLGARGGPSRTRTGGGSASTSARARGSRTSPGSSAGPAVDARRARGHDRVHPDGDQGAAPDPRGRAGAGHALGAPGQRLRRPGAECQLPDRLRRQLAGDRRGVRADPPRQRRRDPLGRHAQHDPSVRRHRVHPADGALHPQRRADPRQPALRPRPRRLHPGRGGRDARARGARARQGARGADLRRGRRLRLDGRRLPDHRQPRRGPRRDRLHARRPWPMRGSTPRISTTSTPTAPAPRSTTRSRPWRSSGPSARRPTRSRSPAPRA